MSHPTREKLMLNVFPIPFVVIVVVVDAPVVVVVAGVVVIPLNKLHD